MYYLSSCTQYHTCKAHDHQWAYLVLAWLQEDKRKHEHKVMRFVWEFGCLHLAQYISIRPHGIDHNQTWCEKIYRMNKANWLNANGKKLNLWIYNISIDVTLHPQPVDFH